MILRLANPTERKALVAVALLVLTLLSYFSIRNARAEHFASLDTRSGLERATQLEPGHARNWYLLGRYWQFNLDDSNPEQALHAYKVAASVDAHSAENWLGLGSVYESVGDFSAANDAFLRAQKAYPLSAEVSWQYGNFLLRQGKVESAFDEMRRAVEADPRRGAEAFSRALRVDPDVDHILDRVLPPIRDVYVEVIWDQVTDRHTDTALKVWDRLSAIHPKLSIQDVFALEGGLLTNKRITEARRVWEQAVVFAGLADLEGPRDSVLWDGGFESGVTGGGFSWTIPQNFPDVQIRRDSAEKHSGQYSLRLTFDGKSNVNFAGVCHYVPVQPSTSYRFSAWVQTRELTSDQGIRFQFHSLGLRDDSATITPDVRGSRPWTNLQAPYVTGSDVQGLQVCLVRLPGDPDGDKIQGTAWVDDVALVPESAEHSRP